MEIDTIASTSSNILSLDISDPSTEEAGVVAEVWIVLKFSHAGKDYTVTLAESDRLDQVLYF